MDGYDTEACGVMFAYDKPLNDQTRVGFGGAYGNTNIHANNSSATTDIIAGFFWAIKTGINRQ